MNVAVTSELLSQTGPDKWDQRLEVRGLRPGLKLGETRGPGSWRSGQVVNPCQNLILSSSLLEILLGHFILSGFSGTGTWWALLSPGGSGSLRSITRMSSGASGDMWMIEFILLNLPPLTCPLPGCYLLTTFRQCSYFPLLLFHVPNPFTSLRPHYHSCGPFVCINTQPHPLGSILLPKELFGIILSFVQCPSPLKSDLINSLTVFFWEIPWSEGPGGLHYRQWGHESHNGVTI